MSPAFPNDFHALVWNGNADSYVDLQSVLPASFLSSFATNINGDTVSGYGFDNTGSYYAIAWTVPEPTALPILALTGGTAIFPRRRRRRGRRRRRRGRIVPPS